jgi:hypothetical protein
MKPAPSRTRDLQVVRPAERFGVKGREAAELLAHCGIPVPPGANQHASWRDADGRDTGRCLRLGQREFIVESDAGAQYLATLQSALPAFPAAWLLPRADHSLLLEGPAWPGRLAQLCSFDFERLPDDPAQVVMTLLADISVIFIREPAQTGSDGFGLRLWCDPGYATYLEHCLILTGEDLQ